MKKRSKRYKDLTKFSTKGKKIEIKEVFDLTPFINLACLLVTPSNMDSHII